MINTASQSLAGAEEQNNGGGVVKYIFEQSLYWLNNVARWLGYSSVLSCKR